VSDLLGTESLIKKATIKYGILTGSLLTEAGSLLSVSRYK